MKGEQDSLLTTDDGRETRVVVTEITERSFRFAATIPFSIGERVWLRLARHGDFPGLIEWVSGSEAGGSFVYQVPLS